nr:immunoglobulin light chain junction region [Macaca mulatta]MPO03773.1 immunoglobulin light chain junction region [Macaca mulatta]MPO04031.1 immunoglobulin light chain junction region [Macaca mulatta]MPO04429.1 immunoglobulin light chain junction region [Macaca mulatta]MPO06919.1 immunoglobulin light chain junction region [Macaca mulatta]
CMIWHNNVYMF